MTRSLLAGTRGIAARAQGTRLRPPRALARETGNAIHFGSLQAMAGFIERAVRLKPLLELNIRHQPDLVLRGLAVLAD